MLYCRIHIYSSYWSYIMTESWGQFKIAKQSDTTEYQYHHMYLLLQVVVCESKAGELSLESFLLPNIAIDDGTPLSTFYVRTFTCWIFFHHYCSLDNAQIIYLSHYIYLILTNVKLFGNNEHIHCNCRSKTFWRLWQHS